MTVYVDTATNQFGCMKMCHMLSDTIQELHDMAHKLGLKRDWFQSASTLPHYDICQSKRKLALAYGAVEIDRNDVVALIRKYRS